MSAPKITLSDTDKVDLMLAAINSTPPNDNPSEFERQAVARLESLTRSMLGGAFLRAIEQVEAEEVFPATILSIDKEESSQRGLVQLKVAPSKWYPDGVQPIRTERTDKPEGQAMARYIRNCLIGHRVLIWKLEEETRSGMAVNVLRFIKDRGVDPEFAPADGTTPVAQAS